MEWTREDILALVKEFNLCEGDSQAQEIIACMMASLPLWLDEKRIARFMGFDEGKVVGWFDRFRRAGLLTEDNQYTTQWLIDGCIVPEVIAEYVLVNSGLVEIVPEGTTPHFITDDRRQGRPWKLS